MDQMDAAGRAAAITPRLVVRTNTAGKPVWNATWRDSQGKPVMRTVGPALLKPIKHPDNPFSATTEARLSKRYVRESWRQAWARSGRTKNGLLDPDDALKRAHVLVLEREEERDDLRDRIGRAHDPRTLGAVCDAWIAEREKDATDGVLKRSTLRDYRAMLAQPKDNDDKRTKAHIWREWGQTAPREISDKDVEKFMDKLRDEAKLSARTRAKYAAVLSMVFDHARRKGWITSNPLADRERKKRTKKTKNKIIVYSVEQVEAIARKAGGQDGEIIRLAAYTGLRQGELLALRWRDVDWTGSALRVASSYTHGIGEDTPKSDQMRSVPLGRQAAEVLERVSERENGTAPGDLVFLGRSGGNVDPSSLRKRYDKARDEVAKEDGDLPLLTFHGLRHTFGSQLAAAGVPLRAIQEFMGHSDPTTTAIYMHFVSQESHAADVTAAFDRHLTDAEKIVEVPAI